VRLATVPDDRVASVDDELDRLRSALATAADELETLARTTTERAGPDVGAIFEAQALFARDPGLLEPSLAAIRDGATAVAAIERVSAALADQLAGIDDDYFRERSADVRDVARRVVGVLTGAIVGGLHHPDGRPAVLVGDDLEPSLVATVRPELVAGIALAGGAPNGHTAIVARSLGMPLVLGLGAALDDVRDGLEVLVDGRAGELVLEPTDDDLRRLSHAAVPASVAASSGRPAGGLAATVLVEANVGSIRDAEEAARADADGIGLVRTELLFLGRSVPPGLDEQRGLYRRIAELFPRAQVVFRTLDIGGDKPASWSSGPGAELNPALGVRGVRLSIAQPELLRVQVRAMLEALAGRSLDLLLPMVSTLEELHEVRTLVEQVRDDAVADGSTIASAVRLGVMVEVPSVALMADAFAGAVDHLSIGTNDLTQYALAADRTHAALAALASPLQPAVVRLVGRVVDAARAAGRPVAVCGEAAADPLAGPLFAALGVTALSVAPSSVAQVRGALARVDPGAQPIARAALAAATVDEVRAVAERVATAVNPRAG
jgi:phosphocarrier protein FPr